jgi:DNA-binding protein HU-beta
LFLIVILLHLSRIRLDLLGFVGKQWLFCWEFAIIGRYLIHHYYATMAKGMTKSQVIASLADKSGMSKKDVSSFLDAMVTMAYAEAKKSGEFTIPGLGKLLKKARAARMGRNPATGESIKIPAKTVVKFRVAKAAKDAIL